MNLEIVPIQESYFDELYEVLDAVASESQFLAWTRAPGQELAFPFYRLLVKDDITAFVALLDGKVVGWCDIIPVRGDARQHVGCLGIGVLKSARQNGIGLMLMRAAMAKAAAKGLTRIELTVRIDNLRARALYERLGFVVEGRSRDAFMVNGQYYDVLSMAYLDSSRHPPAA